MRTKRILFTMTPSNDLGLVSRLLPVAEDLAGRGHRVLFSVAGSSPKKLISGQGFECVLPRHPYYHILTDDLSLSGIIRTLRSEETKRAFGSVFGFAGAFIRSFPRSLPHQTSQILNMDHMCAFAGMASEKTLRSFIEAEIAMMSEIDADLVVDTLNPFACIAARAKRMPLVTVIQGDIHPKNRGFIWWKTPPEKIPSPVSVVNRVLSDYGIASIQKTEELFIGDFTLVTGIPETDPVPDQPGLHYIGPLLWQKPGEKLPEWVVRDREEPLIWVYSGVSRYIMGGSAADSEAILIASKKALTGMNARVIITTGYHPLPNKALPLPDRFRYAPYLPGLALAEASSLMIHHGGHGSCMTGLYAGTPAVIIPTMSERESNARRVAALGAAEIVFPREKRSGKKKWIDPEALREQVVKVLEDPSYARNAKAVSEKMQSYGSAVRAADLIETRMLK